MDPCNFFVVTIYRFPSHASGFAPHPYWFFFLEAKASRASSPYLSPWIRTWERDLLWICTPWQAVGGGPKEISNSVEMESRSHAAGSNFIVSSTISVTPQVYNSKTMRNVPVSEDGSNGNKHIFPGSDNLAIRCAYSPYVYANGHRRNSVRFTLCYACTLQGVGECGWRPRSSVSCGEPASVKVKEK